MAPHLNIEQDAVAAFCLRHRIRKLSLFGSVLRDDFDPDRSDVDVLIEFTPTADRHLSYFSLARMQFELEAIFGHRVDLSLSESLAPYIRNEVLATTEVQYAAA